MLTERRVKELSRLSRLELLKAQTRGGDRSSEWVPLSVESRYLRIADGLEVWG